MTMKVDYSPDTGAVVNCTDCPHWSVWRWSRKGAWEAAQEHASALHGGSKDANAAVARLRHSEDLAALRRTTCVQCGGEFAAKRVDSRFCSNRCRQAQYRPQQQAWKKAHPEKVAAQRKRARERRSAEE